MRRVPLLELGVAAAAVLSAGLLAVMLASPWLPRPAEVALVLPSATSSAEASPEVAPAPTGLFRVRGRLAFGGPCIGIELTEESYPADDETGSARVLWWTPTAVDGGNPLACDTRAGDLGEVAATIEPRASDDEPDGPPIGYTARFRVPVFEDGPPTNVEILILTERSSGDTLQALVLSPEGSPGLVLDRVAEIDPPFEPRPSEPVIGVLPPDGIFLLQGPLAGDAPCLVLELDERSYPAEAAEGTAGIRSWEPASGDADDPAQCLRRSGEIHEGEGAVALVADPASGSTAYVVTFTVPLRSGTEQTFAVSFEAAQPNPDQLQATMVDPQAGRGLVFDRVDSIDPPLGG